MRFKIDENLPSALVRLLAASGHDATSVREEGLNGRPDHEIAKACRSESRAIVSLDLDFADITALPPHDYAGIIVLRISNQSRSHVVRIFRGLLPLLETEVLAGHLWIVEDDRIRIWPRDRG